MTNPPQPLPSGVLLIDKPQGITSFDVIRVLRRITGQRKLGHAGTLDPMATGLLLILFNQATRLSDHLLHASKHYIAQATLGSSTDTDDADGNIISQSTLPLPSPPEITSALSSFVGSSLQRPPSFSALHIDGQRAYDLARQGQVVDIKPRAVEIFSINDISIDLPLVRFSVHCGSGTYIRSIARDLGQLLGCGAHLSALRRTLTAGCSIDRSVTLDFLQQNPSAWSQHLIPMFDALAHLPTLELSPLDAQALSHGKHLPMLATLTPSTYRVPIPGARELLALVEVHAPQPPDQTRLPTRRVFWPAWSPEG
jgi:tRNA pseudouridine55 synthase